MANDSSTSRKPDGAATFVAVVSILVLMYLAAWRLPAGVNLAVNVGLFGILLISLGWTITGRPLGFLVNDLNVMSLSRLQLAGWTAVILSAYLTFVIARLVQGEPDPLRVEFDWHLWSLLGISTSSLVGSSLISKTKKEKEPDGDYVKDAAKATSEETTAVDNNRQGTLYANTGPDDAQFSDLFQGDELVNTTHLDLAKVQMFFFTVITLVTYVVIAAKELRHPTDPTLSHLPDLPEGMIALLGISHAGYLGNKSITHTPAPDPKAKPTVTA